MMDTTFEVRTDFVTYSPGSTEGLPTEAALARLTAMVTHAQECFCINCVVDAANWALRCYESGLDIDIPLVDLIKQQCTTLEVWHLREDLQEMYKDINPYQALIDMNNQN